VAEAFGVDPATSGGGLGRGGRAGPRHPTGRRALLAPPRALHPYRSGRTATRRTRDRSGLTPAGESSGTPKARDGAAEAIRMLRVARRGAAKAVSQAANQLRDLVVTAPGQVREQLTWLPASKRVEPCSRGLRRLSFCGSGLRPISHRILTLR